MSLALGLCFIIWGHGYPIYHKVLKLGLGMQTLAYKNFFNIIKFALFSLRLSWMKYVKWAKTR